LEWDNFLTNTLYLQACTGTGADTLTDQFNAQDGSNVAKRDFTGLDCTGWDYDLHRPFEPYVARGVHPSGVGINRYRKWSDLNQSEKDYLQMQTGLSLLNFVDPFLIGFNGFKGVDSQSGEPFLWNITLRHHLASFGHVINVNFFLKTKEKNILVVLHRYFNGSRDYPGLDVSVLRYPLTTGPHPIKLSTTVSGWMQPEDQLFTSDTGTPGGLINLRTAYGVSEDVEPYLELETKSEGWVAGNVYLDANFSARTGLVVTF